MASTVPIAVVTNIRGFSKLVSKNQKTELQLNFTQAGCVYEFSFALRVLPPPIGFCPELTVSNDTKVLIAIDDQKVAAQLGEKFAKAGIHSEQMRGLKKYTGRARGADLILADVKNAKRIGSKNKMTPQELLRKLVIVAINDSIKVPDIEGQRFILGNRLDHFSIKTLAIPHGLEAVLVDDDKLMHMCWEMDSRTNNGCYLGFRSPMQFFGAVHLIDPCIPLYIDSDLGRAVKGEKVARYIKDYGFDAIFLETGYEAARFLHMPWLTKILSKITHWENQPSASSTRPATRELDASS